MAKGILTIFLVIGLLILGAGLYLGHNGINKLESSYSEALGKQNSVTQKLQADNKRLEEELKKALQDKAAVELELKKQSDLAALSKAEDSKAMAEQIKALNESMQKTVESCQIRPKPIKRAVVAVKKVQAPVVAPKVEERIIIKEVASKPQTIVINKIFIQEGKNKPKLIKQEQKVVPDAYPNDLLK